MQRICKTDFLTPKGFILFLLIYKLKLLISIRPRNRVLIFKFLSFTFTFKVASHSTIECQPATIKAFGSWMPLMSTLVASSLFLLKQSSLGSKCCSQVCFCRQEKGNFYDFFLQGVGIISKNPKMKKMSFKWFLCTHIASWKINPLFIIGGCKNNSLKAFTSAENIKLS